MSSWLPAPTSSAALTDISAALGHERRPLRARRVVKRRSSVRTVNVDRDTTIFGIPQGRLGCLVAVPGKIEIDRPRLTFWAMMRSVRFNSPHQRLARYL